MTSTISVRAFAARSHETPDELRSPEKTRVEVLRFEEVTLARFIFQPGWRWSECVKPVVGTETCQASHVGHVVSGQMTVRMADGSEKSMKPGMSYTIPPGHDAWVDGDEPFVGIEMVSAENYAKR